MQATGQVGKKQSAVATPNRDKLKEGEEDKTTSKGPDFQTDDQILNIHNFEYNNFKVFTNVTNRCVVFARRLKEQNSIRIGDGRSTLQEIGIFNNQFLA